MNHGLLAFITESIIFNNMSNTNKQVSWLIIWTWAKKRSSQVKQKIDYTSKEMHCIFDSTLVYGQVLFANVSINMWWYVGMFVANKKLWRVLFAKGPFLMNFKDRHTPFLLMF